MNIDHHMIDNINKYTFMNALDHSTETFLKKKQLNNTHYINNKINNLNNNINNNNKFNINIYNKISLYTIKQAMLNDINNSKIIVYNTFKDMYDVSSRLYEYELSRTQK